MIVVMEPGADEAAIEAVIAHLVDAGFDVHRSSGQDRTVLGVVGDVTYDAVGVVRELEAVADVVRVSEPFRLASRRFRPRPTICEGAWGKIGSSRPWIAIEVVGLPEHDDDDGESGPPSRELPYEVAAGRPFDAAVTRAQLAPESVGSLACLSIHPSSSRFPIAFVERSPSWGADRWIMQAERELERREGGVVLLECGGEYPNGARSMNAVAIARAKRRTHLPLVVDVPVIAQRNRYVPPIACAAIAAGADGVILRVFVGEDGTTPRVPATLRWDDAVELAERLLAVGKAVRE